MPRSILPLLALAVTGCAASPPSPGASAPSAQPSIYVDADRSTARLEAIASAPGTVTLRAPAEELFAALPDAFAAVGLYASVDPAAMSVTHPARVERRALNGVPLSHYLNCGNRMGIANANSYNVTLTVTSYVGAGAEGASTLRTQVEAIARAPGGSDPPVRCGSTNELERRIERLVRLRLGAVASPPGNR